MNKEVLRIVGLIALACGGMLNATSELRSPLSLMRGTIHYPIPAEDDGEYVVNTWNALYGRSADRAFMPNCNKDCPSAPVFNLNFNDCGKNTTQTQNLSALFFGQSNFKGEQAFAGAMINNAIAPSCVPALNFATLSPEITYNENGLFFGIDFHKKFGCDQKWHGGIRASLPFKVIKVTCDNCCDLEEEFSDVIAERANVNLNAVGTTDNVEYAYRLDFLSSLCLQAVPGSTNIPLLTYDANGVTIAGILFNAANETILLEKRVTGALPLPPFAADPAIATPLNAAGTNGVNNEILAFDTVAYDTGLALNRSAQSQLYLVPATNPAGDALLPNSQIIRNAVDSIMNVLDFTGQNSANNFFEKNCIFLCDNQRVAALGDLFTEYYVGYHPECWYSDVIFGLIFPTGTKNIDPRRTLYQTTGNNRHVEAKFALEGGWQPTDWFAFRSYLSANHVFKATETRAAPFAGQTVKNIGPNINAKISYNYFWGNIDLSFFHPEDSNLGCVLGYELYAKGRDKVDCNSLCAPVTNCCPSDVCPPTVINTNGTVNDLLGVAQTLDYSIIGQGTNTLTQKLRGEVFYRWNYFEIFGGASQIIAGRNAMQETEAHIGVTLNF